MKYAWVENNTIRDVCSGNPSELYHPDIAAFYSTEVEDHITNGATLVDSIWTNLEIIYTNDIPVTEPTPIVPTSLTMRQARLVLHQNNLLTTVEAAVDAADRSVQIEWEFATTIERTWPTLIQLSKALSLTPEQLDDLFITGSTL